MAREFTIANARAPQQAVQKSLLRILKPSRVWAASQNIRPFIKNESARLHNPSVRHETAHVMALAIDSKIGFTVALARPNTKATTSAVKKEPTMILPFEIRAITIIATAFKAVRKINESIYALSDAPD